MYLRSPPALHPQPSLYPNGRISFSRKIPIDNRMPRHAFRFKLQYEYEYGKQRGTYVTALPSPRQQFLPSPPRLLPLSEFATPARWGKILFSIIKTCNFLKLLPCPIASQPVDLSTTFSSPLTAMVPARVNAGQHIGTAN